MGRLFVLFFLLPWWAYVPASIGVLWVGERAYERALETEAEKAAALEAPVPDPVDLAGFDINRDIHAADEVHVTGWMDPERRHELVKTRYGVTTAPRHMYPMFGPSEPEDAREVRAALMLTQKQHEVFLERGDAFIAGLTDAGKPVFTFNGFGETQVSMGDMAADAMAELGLVQSGNFVFIEPFLAGREAALAKRGIPEQSRYTGWLIAALVALIGVVKRVRSVRARLARDAQEAVEPDEVGPYVPAPAPAPSAAFAVPQGVPEDTPLGRLVRRNAHSSLIADARVDEPGLEVSDPAEDLESETTEAAPAPSPDGGARRGGGARSPFPPMGEIGDTPAPAPRPSALAFYVKLLLSMLVVGGVAYDPSLIDAALPFVGIALFVFGVYAVVRTRRKIPAEPVGGDEMTPQHRRRPDGAAQSVAVGVGGRRIDLTAPVRGAGHERGVI